MKRRSQSPILLGLFVFSLSLTGCWLRSENSQKTVLVVNNRKLIVKDFANLLARRLRGYDALKAKDAVSVNLAKEEIVKSFILNSLIKDYAEVEKITVSDDELNKEINAFRATYPDDISFRNVLAEEGISFSEWKDKLSFNLLNKKVFAKLIEKIPKPSDEDIRNYYEQNKNDYKRKERIYVRQIITDDLEKAKAIREELKKKDFAETAKKYSISPEAKNGGLVGWIESGSVDIFDKAFSLPIGGISPVLESVYGFHIFKVEKKEKAGYGSLEEVKPIIVSSLRAQKEQAEFAKWLDKKIRSSHVYKDTRLIDSMSIETRGD